MDTTKRSVLSIFTCFSGSSPRVPNKSDYIKKIKDQAESLGIGGVDANLEALSNYISQYLEFIQHRREKPSKPNAAKSDFLFKLKDMVVEGGQAFKAYFPDAKSIVQQSFQGLGATHILATGFLLVANIMDRYDKIRHNKGVCLSLLKEMTRLVQDVKKLRNRRRLREGMKIQIEKAVGLIIEVSLACCTQIKQPGFFHFFSTTVNQEALLDFQGRLTELRDQITWHMKFAMYDLVEKGQTPLPRVSDKFITENKVHIEKVIDLLEWKSNEKAVAVILYGLGGIGKTTLANAVFRKLRGEEACKDSYVRLFEKITVSPDIKKLQTQILEDLIEPPIPKIPTFDAGQDEIEKIIQKEEVFIYIDNVLFREVGQGLSEVEELLPMATEKVRKLRLLITARDKGAARRAFNKLRIQTKFYHVETLPDTRAMELVQKQLNERLVSSQISQERLDSSQISQIVQICGGIPRLLMEVAESEKYAENIREAREEFRAGSIVEEIDRYVFAHKYLYKDLTDPFFDICLYFEAWDWEELSNIVGETKLKGLEDMALLTKDVESMTAKVHNVILAIGLHYMRDRFKFTNASDFQVFLDETEAEDLEKIKGIWASDISGPLDIPASKLDLMRKSLRVLALGKSTEVKDQFKKEFDELYFFSAPGISHLPFAPSRLKELRYLCYKPKDLQNLSQMSSHLSNLRVLQLREAQLKRLPEWKALGKGIQVIKYLVNGLRQRGSLESPPESIGKLRLLDSIDLSFTDLEELPDVFCSLSSLTKLAMNDCRRLEKLPDRFGDIARLRKLSLVGCNSLKELPASFSRFHHLEDLNLSGCKKLTKLPEGFHLLTVLKHLYLSDCDTLEGQPMENIVKMEKLEIVEIHRSPLLHEEWQKIEVGCIQWSHKVRS